MDLLLPSYFPQSRCCCYNISWSYIMITLWMFQNLFLSVGYTASVALNKSVSPSHVLTGRQLLRSVLPHHNVTSGSTDSIKICEGCKSGERGKFCSGEDQEECDCSNDDVICHCKDEWIGDACQYKISKVNCEKMRSCILCRVYKRGPLAEEKDCYYYCQRSYPTPLIVKNLHFQDDEHLCSFIYHKGGEIESDCRYFFKYGKINPDGTPNSSNFYIVAQQDMVCGKTAKFPLLRSNSSVPRNNKNSQIFERNYETIIKGSDFGVEHERKNSFIAIVIVFVFIALPFVTCIFALIYNFSNLPCGLCNIFRQSSAKYLRNVRPFPGYVPTEQTTHL